MDRDGSGEVAFAGNLAPLFLEDNTMKVQAPPTDDDAARLNKLYDADGDGKLSPEEQIMAK